MRRAALLAVLVLAACGYHLAGTGTTVPEGARTIRIERFTNHTREAGLDVHLHRAVEDEFRRQGTLRVVTEGDADVVLSGAIRRFTSVPVAFSATDEAVQYQGIMQVSLRLTEHESGHVLFENKLLQESQDFGAVSGVVISSSPHFQRGTINARDLPDLTNVQIGEARRREAQGDLIELLARDIYLQTMEGF
jgi:lipopolysaccharide assembly LptE-like protein